MRDVGVVRFEGREVYVVGSCPRGICWIEVRWARRGRPDYERTGCDADGNEDDEGGDEGTFIRTESIHDAYK